LMNVRIIHAPFSSPVHIVRLATRSAGGSQRRPETAAKPSRRASVKIRRCSSFIHTITAEAWKNVPVAILLTLIIQTAPVGVLAHSCIAC
jgi:hypothetical protein